MAGVFVTDSTATRRFLARLTEVHAAVELAADAIGVEARALFASHDNPGGHHIDVNHDRVDSFVSLVGPSPWSVEYGHVNARNRGGAHVKGLHILGRAAHL